MKIAVMTDSGSGINPKMAESLGVFLIPTPFFINEKLYHEDVDITSEEFYKKLEEDVDVKTSMPSIGDVAELWDELLKEYDEIVYIPISSGLSSSLSSANMLANDYDNRVFVVDNRRVSVIQYQSVLDALELAKKGKTGKEIKEILEKYADRASIYISLETLKYLKKGGRITPAAAAIGTLLNIKPILQIQGSKLDAYSKCRGKAQAKKIMLEAIKKDMETRFKDCVSKKRVYLGVAYTGNLEEAVDWKREVENTFKGYEVVMHPLSLTVACHIGYGALAITCCEYLPDDL